MADMKKWWIVFPVIFIVLLAGIYIFIPGQLTVSKIALIQGNRNGIFRILSDKNKWPQWWPGKTIAGGKGNSLYYNQFDYSLDQILYGRVQVFIENNKMKTMSTINIIPIHTDSVALQWKCELSTGFNPINKIICYQEAKAIKNDMADILDHFRSFVEKAENIYGFNIQHTTLKDTVLVATKIVTTTYPSTQTIYKLVDHLKQYIAQHGAKEVNYPMLNITKKDSAAYIIMVGIPTDRQLVGNSTIFYKRLSPIPNKILTTEVKGGPGSIHHAYKVIETYMIDHQLSPPVIPFEYMVTDRSKESDTSKWVTKIYYPII